MKKILLIVFVLTFVVSFTSCRDKREQDRAKYQVEKVKKDTDRNFWMSPAEALDYGIVGKIITHYDDLKLD